VKMRAAAPHDRRQLSAARTWGRGVQSKWAKATAWRPCGQRLTSAPSRLALTGRELPSAPGPLLRAALDSGALQLLEALLRQAARRVGDLWLWYGPGAILLEDPTHVSCTLATLLAHCELPVAVSFLVSLCKVMATADAASPAGQVLRGVSLGLLSVPWGLRLQPGGPVAAQPDAAAGATAAAGAAQQQGAAVPAAGGAAAGSGVGEGGGAGRGGGEQADAGPSGVSGGHSGCTKLGGLAWPHPSSLGTCA
jgi:hypothetical protein